MPVVTRSQTIKLQQSESEIKTKKLVKVKPSSPMSLTCSQMLSLNSWFIATIKQRLALTDSTLEYKKELTVKRLCAKASGNKVLAKRLNKLYRLAHFDNIRNVDETMYLVQQYLPMLYNESRFRQFTCTVYKQIDDLYKQIHYSEPKMRPRTDVEQKIVNSLISTLDETHEVVHRLLDM